jgi:hypothetical protein
MMFNDFGPANAFCVGELVKPQEPNDTERLRVIPEGPGMSVKLPVGRLMKKVTDMTSRLEYASPLAVGDTAADIYGIVLDDIVEGSIHSKAAEQTKSYVSGESALIGRFSAKLSVVPFSVPMDGLPTGVPWYLYAIKRQDETLGGIFISDDPGEAGDEYIALDPRFSYRFDSLKGNSYLEFNPGVPSPGALPIATATVPGIVSVGAGLAVTAAGVLSVSS